jgi:hypothetical protein
MANLKTKIERHNLETRVADLMRSGVVSSRSIAAALNAGSDGRFSISYRAVNEYVKKLRAGAVSNAGKILQEHVDRVITSDLETLEDLQRILVKWGKENPADLADRLAAARARMDGAVERWRALLDNAVGAESADKRVKALTAIVREALEMVLAEDRLQDQRTRAMLAALKIITVKVDKGALMEGEGRGNIIIVDGEGRVKEGPVTADGARQKFAMVIGGAGKLVGGEGCNE